MEKDKRYKSVHVLIDGGHISTFKEILDFIPKSTVYHDMGINYSRFVRCIANPMLFTLKEVTMLSELFGVEFMIMIKLIYDQARRRSRASKSGSDATRSIRSGSGQKSAPDRA